MSIQNINFSSNFAKNYKHKMSVLRVIKFSTSIEGIKVLKIFIGSFEVSLKIYESENHTEEWKALTFVT